MPLRAQRPPTATTMKSMNIKSLLFPTSPDQLPRRQLPRRVGPLRPAVERVESRILFALAVTTPLPDVTVEPGASQTIDLAGNINNEEIDGTIVRLTTNVGAMDLELFDTDAPLSVANFLNYVNTDQYNGTIFHRAVNDFVVQGGGYTTTGADITGPGTPTVPNEFSSARSNVRGTVAYAKLSGQPDSATSEFFVNLSDNLGLDQQNGGFTVFGRVLENGIAVADAIDELPKTDAAVGPQFFQDLPVLTPTANPTPNDLVVLQDASVVPETTYSVQSSDPNLVNASVTGNTLNLTFGTGTGLADVTVTGTDPRSGATVQDVFRVGVGVPVTSVVDVTIGDGTQRTVNFTDADGTRSSISLNGGTATVRFSGVDVTQAVAGRAIDVTGTGVEVTSIDTTGTTARSRLSITGRGGDDLVTINGINANAPIGTVTARNATLRGAANFASTVGRLDLARALGGTINIGGTPEDRPSTISIVSAEDTDITSTSPVRSLSLGGATNVDPEADIITAPSIGRLTANGDYVGSLNTASLGTARIGGGVASGTWNVGDARSITVGSTGPAWVGNFAGGVRSFSTTGDLSGTLNAASVNRLRVGSMTGANVNLTQAPAPRTAPALGQLVSTGAITNSAIRSSHDLGNINAGGITGSTIYAGVVPPAGTLLPTDPAAFVTPATIRGVNIRTRGAPGFSKSAIAASTLGRMNLGLVNTENGGVPFGLAGQTIASVNATGSAGNSVRRSRLTEPADSLTFGDFNVLVY